MGTTKKTVLVVDDVVGNVVLIGSLLKEYFDVRSAVSAEIALTLLSKTKVDLILLDIEMPGMSGFDLLQEIKLKDIKNRNTPVIFITAHSDLELIGKAVKLGAKHYILKPIVPEALIKKIDEVVCIPGYIPKDMEGMFKKLIYAADNRDRMMAETIITGILALAKKEGIVDIYLSMDEITRNIGAYEFRSARIKTQELIEKVKDQLKEL